jgi:hypothetical protein
VRLHAVAVDLQGALAGQHRRCGVPHVDAGVVEGLHAEPQHVVTYRVGATDDLRPFDTRLVGIDAELGAGPNGVGDPGGSHERLGGHTPMVGAGASEVAGLGQQDAVPPPIRDRECGLRPGGPATHDDKVIGGHRSTIRV